VGQRLHQFGRRRDARRERQRACGGSLEQVGRGARTDAENGADRFRTGQIVRIQDGANPDDGFRHVCDDRLCGRDRSRRAQRDFQYPHAARNQCPGERDGVFKPLDGKNRDDDGLSEQRGELFLF